MKYKITDVPTFWFALGFIFMSIGITIGFNLTEIVGRVSTLLLDYSICFMGGVFIGYGIFLLIK